MGSLLKELQIPRGESAEAGLISHDGSLGESTHPNPGCVPRLCEICLCSSRESLLLLGAPEESEDRESRLRHRAVWDDSTSCVLKAKSP